MIEDYRLNIMHQSPEIFGAPGLARLEDFGLDALGVRLGTRRNPRTPKFAGVGRALALPDRRLWIVADAFHRIALIRVAGKLNARTALDEPQTGRAHVAWNAELGRIGPRRTSVFSRLLPAMRNSRTVFLSELDVHVLPGEIVREIIEIANLEFSQIIFKTLDLEVESPCFMSFDFENHSDYFGYYKKYFNSDFGVPFTDMRLLTGGHDENNNQMDK